MESKKEQPGGGFATYQNASGHPETSRNKSKRLARSPARAVCNRTAEIVDIGTVAVKAGEGLVESTKRCEPGETKKNVDL